MPIVDDHPDRKRRPGLPSLLGLIAVLTAVLVNTSPGGALAATPSPVSLGAASSFPVLGAGGVTSTGLTVVSGDLGTAAGSAVVGFPPGKIGGDLHQGDSVAAQALQDAAAAQAHLAALTPTTEFAGDQNGKTFGAGVYHTIAAFALTGTMMLDAQNDPDAVFIFQVDAALNVAASGVVQLVNGAKSSHSAVSTRTLVSWSPAQGPRGV